LPRLPDHRSTETNTGTGQPPLAPAGPGVAAGSGRLLSTTGRRRHIIRRHTRLGRAAAIAAIVVLIPYLSWRLLWAMSPEWWWLSALLIACDLHGALGFALYTMELWDLDCDRPPTSPALPWKVAVLITTYNEPPEVLLPTVAASVALEPEHETWVLDDGRRPEIAAMAARLGARYLTRPDNAHAKAGNLNHALKVIDADIVGVLDADHAPSARFLTATLPYFSDPALAFVQTPQDFYNHDSFEHTDQGHRSISEEDLFYQAIAPGKNRWEAVFWCGTCAVLRTLALVSVGGAATETVTEDVHTSVRMYRQGWKGLFLPDVLAHGLAPHDSHGFLVQRHRWAQGNVQVLRLDNPLLGPGMTLAQRIAFFTSLSTWFSSWRTLGYLLVPLIVLLTGATPIVAPPEVYMPVLVGILALQLTAVRLYSGSAFSFAASMTFEIVRLPALLPATMAFFRPGRRTSFHVTPKGKSEGERRRAPVPPLLLWIAAAQAFALGWFAVVVTGLVPFFHYASPLAPTFVAPLTVISLAITINAINRIRSSRFSGNRRAATRLPVWTQARIGDVICVVLDLSVTGARIRVPDTLAAELGGEVEVSFATPHGMVRLDADVRRRFKTDGGADRFATEVGLEFEPDQEAALGRLAVALFQPDVLGDVWSARDRAPADDLLEAAA
jgi:cellulose synthase/poly-beta-1,6-N-acetylglucosamine synthase-like glycosyltransferase